MRSAATGRSTRPSVPRATRGRPPNAVYVQSGGATAVINASAAGVIETARRHRERIGTVFAARYGIGGLLAEDLVDTAAESAAAIAALRERPGSAFGASRAVPPPIEQDRRTYERLVAVFRAHDIRYCFYNGGNGSMDTAWELARVARVLDYPLVSIGIPKTIDNDIVGTHACPGYGSAARYVATSVREIALDLAAMARASTRVVLLEVMGRNTGWLALAAGLAADAACPVPLVLVLPEIPFDTERFLAAVKRRVETHGHCVVVVAEGSTDGSGRRLADRWKLDRSRRAPLGGVAPALGKIIGDRLRYKYQFAVSSYLQRAARHLASRFDVDLAYESGAAAVRYALAGRNGTMPALVQTGPSRFAMRPRSTRGLGDRERPVPRGFLARDGFDLSAAGRRYLAPLVAGEAPVPFSGGVPRVVTLVQRPVTRLLPTFE